RLGVPAGAPLGGAVEALVRARRLRGRRHDVHDRPACVTEAGERRLREEDEPDEVAGEDLVERPPRAGPRGAEDAAAGAVDDERQGAVRGRLAEGLLDGIRIGHVAADEVAAARRPARVLRLAACDADDRTVSREPDGELEPQAAGGAGDDGDAHLAARSRSRIHFSGVRARTARFSVAARLPRSPAGMSSARPSASAVWVTSNGLIPSTP